MKVTCMKLVQIVNAAIFLGALYRVVLSTSFNAVHFSFAFISGVFVTNTFYLPLVALLVVVLFKNLAQLYSIPLIGPLLCLVKPGWLCTPPPNPDQSDSSSSSMFSGFSTFSVFSGLFGGSDSVFKASGLLAGHQTVPASESQPPLPTTPTTNPTLTPNPTQIPNPTLTPNLNPTTTTIITPDPTPTTTPNPDTDPTPDPTTTPNPDTDPTPDPSTTPNPDTDPTPDPSTTPSPDTDPATPSPDTDPDPEPNPNPFLQTTVDASGRPVFFGRPLDLVNPEDMEFDACQEFLLSMLSGKHQPKRTTPTPNVAAAGSVSGFDPSAPPEPASGAGPHKSPKP
ncbi:hypothetical protein NEDG_00862 [Nematocida displodere]|uniref:Uncharacterized protein n=1 Tax=Nematocida displodere TaxID=1805483 RepID=A0A177EFG0_9MICR|nr:hypothetical protein NEDG_00862 [Nematocida displodere]